MAPAPIAVARPAEVRELPSPSVRESIADLQRRHGLPITGRMDVFTARAWRRELAWSEL